MDILKYLYHKITGPSNMEIDDKEMTEPEEDHEQDTKEDSKDNSKAELKLTKIDTTDMPFVEEVSSKLSKLEYHVVQCEEDKTFRFRQIEDNKMFKFVDQKHYDNLGDVLCDWIQAYMVDHYKMKKVKIPFKDQTAEGAARAPIFVSDDWETNTERALVLIQGTGDVRAGFWARSVAMNDTLDLGSTLPDIEFAKQNGFSCIVLNPNYNKSPKGTLVDKKIRGMNHHSNYVWKHFVESDKWQAKEIYIVAHSAGGGCAHEIIVRNEQTMIDRVRAIALTDACHGNFYRELGEEGKAWAKESWIAYDASSLPLDEPLGKKYSKSNFPEVSAGHTKHVYTTGCARVSYLKWFLSRCRTL